MFSITNIIKSNNGAKISLYHRIRDTPKDFSDDDLLHIAKRYNGVKLRGANAKIEMAALLELDRRHSPTHVLQSK